MYKAVLVVVAAVALVAFAAGAKESGTTAVQKHVSKMEQALDAAK
jgi:outer membrane lipoprotein-sorting protein